jgi:hypothetical protein
MLLPSIVLAQDFTALFMDYGHRHPYRETFTHTSGLDSTIVAFGFGNEGTGWICVGPFDKKATLTFSPPGEAPNMNSAAAYQDSVVIMAGQYFPVTARADTLVVKTWGAGTCEISVIATPLRTH